jgi:hypothetical protein
VRPSDILLLTTLAFALLLAPLAAEVKVPRVARQRFSHPDSPQRQPAVAAFEATDRLTVLKLLDRRTREALKVGVDPTRGDLSSWVTCGDVRCG